jgi:hypothetical protein
MKTQSQIIAELLASNDKHLIALANLIRDKRALQTLLNTVKGK